MEKIEMPGKRMAWLSADLHKWLKRQAFERETTISAEIDAAVREYRARQEAAQKRQAQRQPVQP